MHRALVLALLAFLSWSALAQTTTVILVRHGEKVTDPAIKDPSLTAAGAQRAKELARVLADAGITAILVTPYARTRETAAPTAAALGLEAVEIQAGETYAKEVADRIRASHKGGTVLVVGHSNTTPNVIQALGVPKPPEIPDSQYDALYVVTLVEGHEPRLVSLRYGAPGR